MKRTILILGAGLMQEPAIKSAKNLNLNTIVVDGNSSAVAKSLADDFYHIDLKDSPSLVDLAKRIQKTKGLHAIFTAGTDFSSQVSLIAQECNLPSHSHEAALNATDKFRMRQCFAQHNVPSPSFCEVTKDQLLSTKNNFLLKNLFQGASFPLVVKPVDSMGGRGCKIVSNESELSAALEDSIFYSCRGSAIVESFIDGREFSIDSLLYQGQLIITGFADRHIFYPPHFIEMGHTMPTQISDDEKMQILCAFEKGVHSLDLSHGACKGDIKLSTNGAMIGEIAARLSGGYMSGWTFPYAAHINITEQAILLALGEKPPIFNSNFPLQKISKSLSLINPQKASAERAWISIPGIVKKIYGIQEAQKTPLVKNVFPRSQIGDCVVFPQNNVEKCGNVISKADSIPEAIFASESAVQKITLHLECPNEQTQNFLSNK
ncbi:MAG: ATP-grasp domain-containing protein, partial [Treponemataceae bacterium]